MFRSITLCILTVVLALISQDVFADYMEDFDGQTAGSNVSTVGWSDAHFTNPTNAAPAGGVAEIRLQNVGNPNDAPQFNYSGNGNSVTHALITNEPNISTGSSVDISWDQWRAGNAWRIGIGGDLHIAIQLDSSNWYVLTDTDFGPTDGPPSDDSVWRTNNYTYDPNDGWNDLTLGANAASIGGSAGTLSGSAITGFGWVFEDNLVDDGTDFRLDNVLIEGQNASGGAAGTPEPSTFVLALLGLVGFATTRRSRRRRC